MYEEDENHDSDDEDSYGGSNEENSMNHNKIQIPIDNHE
jgi:hypothetical protein